MAFDPDKYLAKKQAFDPDSYLKSKETSSLPKEEPGQLEALLRGGAQGATLGFADELAGAGEAAGDALTGNVGSLQDLIDKYKQHRDESRTNFKAAEEAHPITSMLGNIGGGLLTGIPLAAATGGGSLAAEAGLEAKLIHGAKTGAALGASTGLGESEANDVSGDVLNAAKGGTFGAGAGGILSAAGHYLGKAGKALLNETEMGRIAKGAFNKGVEGEALVGPSNAKLLGKNVIDQSQDAIDKLLAEREAVGASKGSAIDRFDAAGNKIDTTQALDDSLEKLNAVDTLSDPDIEKEVARLRNLIETRKNGIATQRTTDTLVPNDNGLSKLEAKKSLAEAENVALGTNNSPQVQVIERPDGKYGVYLDPSTGETKLQKLGPDFINEPVTETVREGGQAISSSDSLDNFTKKLSKINSFEDHDVSTIKNDLVQALKDSQQQVPGVQDYNSMYKQLSDAFRIVSPNEDADVARKKLTQMVNGLERVGPSGDEAREGFSNFINKIKEVNPDLASDLEKKLKSSGESLYLSGKTLSENSINPHVIGTTRSLIGGGSNLAGQAYGAVSNSGVGQLASGVYNLPGDSMKLLAQKAASSGGATGEKLAQMLNGVANQDNKAKNAMMFVIMQNPVYRKLIGFEADK